MSSVPHPLVSGALTSWLLIPENAAFLNWVSFLIGGGGLIFALAGLGLALKQLRAIKTETEASKAAIEAVQLKVASFDTAQECHIASGLIAEIQRGLHSRSWPEVIAAYENLIQSFLRLSHSNSSIAADDRALLVKFTKDMANICAGIRKKQLIPKPVVLRGQDQALRNFSDIMMKITFAVAEELKK